MTHIELFAGCGGLALGLERAGFRTVAMNDFDKAACKTLEANKDKFHNAKIFCEGIETFVDKIGEFRADVISGGPPCQSFSYAGKKLGLEDTRGTMFYYYAKCLEQVKPKAFVFENVRGMLTHDKGRTFETIRNVLAECGYKVRYKLFNASYYGVPQNRERLIVVGFRNDIDDRNFEWPVAEEEQTTMRTVILEQNPDINDSVRYSDRLTHLFNKIGQGEWWYHHRDDAEVMDYVNPDCKKLGGGNTGVLRRISLNEPCPTLLTSPQMKLTQRCHPLETRPFSIREYARIQTFPDDFEFIGSKADRYKQIGNAVPVLLAQKIGDSVMRVLV